MRCHVPEYLPSATYDVNQRRIDYSQFNPPSLWGVCRRDELFHDNRQAARRRFNDPATPDEELLARDLPICLLLRSLRIA